MKFIKLIFLSILLLPLASRLDAMESQPELQDHALQAKNTNLLQAAKVGALETTKELIKDGANVNCADAEGNSPLIFAAFYGHQDCVRLLIDSGADVNQINNWKDKWTALQFACARGHAECVRLLIDSGANIDHVNNKGNTALMNAVDTNHITCVRILLEAGANVNCVNKWNLTALNYAVARNNQDMASLLVSAGANVNHKHGAALGIAAKMGNRESVRFLMQRKTKNNSFALLAQTNFLPLCEFTTQVMLEMPNAKQSNWLINALCCLRRTFGKDITSSLFKAPLLAIISEENSKDPNSFALQEINKIKNEEIQKHLLDKYIKVPASSCAIQ